MTGRDGITGAARNEHRGDDLHDGGAVHVDGHAQRQNKGGNALIHAELFLADLDVQGQGRSAGRGGEAENGHVCDLFDELDGVQLGTQCHDQRIGHHKEDQQQDHRDHHIDQRGLEVIDAVDGKGAGQQHEDGEGREVADDEVQEDHHHIVDLAQQTAEGGGAALTEGIHAQPGGHSKENCAQHRAVAAKGRDDVGGDDVQHHVQRVGAGGAGGLGQALNVGIEQPHGIGGVTHDARQQQRQKRAQQEPEQGLGRDAAHGAGVRNAADGQRNGGEDHRDDDQLQRLDEELADDVEEAEGALGPFRRDVLEQEVVDGGPHLCAAAGDQALPQEHEGDAGCQTTHQRDGHPLGKR